MESSLDKRVSTTILSSWILHGNSIYSVLQYDNFSSSDISQGSVAKFARCAGIFNVDFIANFPTSLSLKVCKSVSTWRYYWQKYVGAYVFGPPWICFRQKVGAWKSRGYWTRIVVKQPSKNCTVHSAAWTIASSTALWWNSAHVSNEAAITTHPLPELT